MNFLGLGPMELLLILVLALIVFGPRRLPELMGQMGKAIGDFRRATSELSEEFNRTITTEVQETRAILDETRQVFEGTYVETVHPAPEPEAAPPIPPMPQVAEPTGQQNGVHVDDASNGMVPAYQGDAPERAPSNYAAADAEADHVTDAVSEPVPVIIPDHLGTPPARPAPNVVRPSDDLAPPY